jgi:hypothetical protein
VPKIPPRPIIKTILPFLGKCARFYPPIRIAYNVGEVAAAAIEATAEAIYTNTTEEAKRSDTCETHPLLKDWRKCEGPDKGWKHTTAEQAFKARYPHVKNGDYETKKKDADNCGGGGGKHVLYIRKKPPMKGEKFGSSLCCNCCEDGENGPKGKTECKFIISAN